MSANERGVEGRLLSWPSAAEREKLARMVPEIREDLARLIAVSSIADVERAEEGAPFGREPREALELALAQSQRLGLRTYAEPQGYYGYAEIGKAPVAGEKGVRIDIPVHLDVVPALHPEEWESRDPFRLLVKHDPSKGGEIWIGRGVVDDKGPAVMMLYVLAALQAVGLDPRVTIRVLFALAEETGDWGEIEAYAEKEGYPDLALVPDNAFPWFTEQDILFTRTTGRGHPLPPGVADSNGIRVESIETGGNAINCVPAEVVSVVSAGDRASLEALREKLSLALAATFDDAIAKARPATDDAERAALRARCAPSFSEIREEGGCFGMTIVARGLAEHACEAWKGVSAVHALAVAFDGVAMADTTPARGLYLVQAMIRQGLGPESTGYFLDIERKPPETHGMQTFTMGVMKANDSGLRLEIDHRVRLGASIEGTRKVLSAITAEHGFETMTELTLKGITPPADHPVLTVMREALMRETGKEPVPQIMGGGTIARKLSDPADDEQLSIGFGIVPEGDPSTEHKPDEYLAAHAVEAGLKIYFDTLHALAAAGSSFVASRVR